MASGYVRVRLVNQQELARRLDRMKGEGAQKALRATMSDMARRGPTIVARVTSQVYDVSQNKLNPNTKSGKGSVGVDMAGLTLVYVGERLHIGGSGFKMSPTARSSRSTGTLKTRILKGGMKTFGHWAPPFSEGGRYGPRSPWMLLPGVKVPLMRRGEATGEEARGLSVPQMVVSDRTEAKSSYLLGLAMVDRLEHNMSRFM